jgi:ariadne-1
LDTKDQGLPPTKKAATLAKGNTSLQRTKHLRKKPSNTALPTTPKTTSNSPAMDSDDDFNSQRSTDDEVMEDFESGFSDDGTLQRTPPPFTSLHIADNILIDMDAMSMEDGDVDDGFDSNEKITKPDRQAYEVEFSVHTPKDIDSAQTRLVNGVKDILGQPPEATAILLRAYRWNKEKLIESYMERQAEVLEAAGMEDDESGENRVKSVSGFTCDICCNDEDPISTFSLKCGHQFCLECYKTYITTKIGDEAEAARIKCPGEDCNRVVDSKSMELLLPDSLKSR